ncbi:unnamed protein product [Scytosiphon promiscuus]
MALNATRPSSPGAAAADANSARARGGAGSRRGSASGGGGAQHDVVDLSAMENSSAGSESGSDSGASRKAKPEKKQGGGAGKHRSATDDEAETKKRDQRARAAERKRDKRAEAKEKEAQMKAKDNKGTNTANEKLPPLRVAINSPGMGWLQPAAAMSSTAEATATAAAAAMAAASPESRARIERVAAAADELSAKVASGAMGGMQMAVGGGLGGASGNTVYTGAGGPWAHASGMKSIAMNSGPMCPEAVQALLADTEKSKTLISNLIVERIREVDSAKRKRDQYLGERKRLARDRSKAQQRHMAIFERRNQPALPVDDSLLGALKPLAGESVVERPPVLKKLGIAANVSGPILRAWDFLHLNSQVITLTPFALDDFADSLHYGGGASVMVAEVHTRLLSVILRDGKFPKNLSAALDAAAAGDTPVASSSVFVGAAACAAAAAAAAAAKASVGATKLGAGKMASSKQGLMGTPSGKGKGSGSGSGGGGGGGSVSRSHLRPRRATNGGGAAAAGEEEEGEEEGEEAWIMALLPPRSDRNEQHDTAYSLVTALTWQTVLALALPHMGPYARAVAPSSPTLGSLSLCLAAAPAGTAESKRGSKLAVQAAERVEAERLERGKALVRARRSLLEQEYCSIPLQEKVLLLEVLVDAAYETKRIRSMLAENMAARMSLESQRREEIIVYNRELREKATAQKAKVHARLRKSNEDLYKRRAAEAEKAAAERAKRAVELGLVAAVALNGGKDADADPAAPAAAAANGSTSNGSRAAGVSWARCVAAGGEHGGATVPRFPSSRRGCTRSQETNPRRRLTWLVFVCPRAFPTFHETQLQSGILEETVKDACGGEYKLRSINIPEDDVDPYEVGHSKAEEERATEALMLENLSRIELMKRRREKEAKDKERNKLRQQWKEGRQQRSLKSAVVQGDVDVLEEALKDGRKVLLEEEEDDGTLVFCPEMRDAYVALSTAKERKGRTEILQKYNSLMAEKFVRTEPLGSDREGRRYWMFEGDQRIHVEIVSRKQDVPKMDSAAVETDAASATKSEPGDFKGRGKDGQKNRSGSGSSAGAEINGASKAKTDADADGGGRSGGSRNGASSQPLPKRAPHPPMEAYHPVWSESVWMYYDTAEEFRNLILSLDPRGKREAELRQALEERFDIAELERNAKERRAISMSGATQGGPKWLEEGSDYLGKRVRRVFGRRIAGATVVRWIPKESNHGLALWHLRHDDGDEEDLEEFEVKEGMAMAEAEEALGSGPGSTVSSLVKSAVDGSLTQTFSEYTNRLNKMQAIKPRDLGISALQETLLHREAAMLDDIKDRTRDYAKGTNTSTPRGAWLRLVKDATEISEMKEAILMLEETLRGLQEGEDKMEGGRMELEAQGWNFSPDAHPLIGRRCRRFFKEFGKSDCTVAAHLPAKNGDPELWHVVHDDGDEEDMEEHELSKARKYFTEGSMSSMPDSHIIDDGHFRGVRLTPSLRHCIKFSLSIEDLAKNTGGTPPPVVEPVPSEDEDGLDSSPTHFRATLWENWGARQGWVKAVKAAKTVGTLALGFLTLVETAYLFGIGKESMLEANRSRARMAKAWETPGKSGKSSRRAAAVAASVAISNFASDMDVDAGESPAGSGAGKRRSSRGEGGGGSADKRQRR